MHPFKITNFQGTTIYDTKKGAFVDVDILDIMQIFGRAGRPQFDTSGSAVLITSHTKIVHYLRLITLQVPIESQFLKSLDDNLNAEVGFLHITITEKVYLLFFQIVLGTVSTVQEAVEWMNYTYFYLRLSNVRTVLEATGEEVCGFLFKKCFKFNFCCIFLLLETRCSAIDPFVRS